MKYLGTVKYLAPILIAGGTLLAQNGGHAAGGVTFTSPGGYGNVAFPGTGHPNFANSLGASVAGRQIPLRNGIGNGNRRNGVGGGGYGAAYGYPVFVGGYDNSYFDQGSYGNYGAQQQQPNVTIINNMPPAPAPAVVINQYMAPPAPPNADSTDTLHVFQPEQRYPSQPASTETPAAAPPHYFLIAYKDHSVYSALTYWIEDKTMHYVTPQQTHNQASLDLIDMDFTKKLNER